MSTLYPLCFRRRSFGGSTQYRTPLPAQKTSVPILCIVEGLPYTFVTLLLDFRCALLLNCRGLTLSELSCYSHQVQKVDSSRSNQRECLPVPMQQYCAHNPDLLHSNCETSFAPHIYNSLLQQSQIPLHVTSLATARPAIPIVPSAMSAYVRFYVV